MQIIDKTAVYENIKPISKIWLGFTIRVMKLESPNKLKILIFLLKISPKPKIENIVVALNIEALAPVSIAKHTKNKTDKIIEGFLSILKIFKITLNAKYIIPTCNPLIARIWSVPVLANKLFKVRGMFSLLPNKMAVSIEL